MTGSSGAKVVSLVPAETPVWYAQSTASLYQFAVRSVNGVSPLTAGPPTKLYRICTSCARVVTPRGAKTCVSMPDM